MRMRPLLRSPRLRKFAIAAVGLGAIALLGVAILSWRLSSGPIELDIATPWLTAAIKENFGSGHQVEVGGTQLERDANGRTSLRIRDIVVLDPRATPVLAGRQELSRSLEDVLFSLMILGDDRAVRATYVAGRKLHERPGP